MDRTLTGTGAPDSSTSQPSNDRDATPQNGLLFITGSTPDDFRSKQNMTRVRKKAMGSFLERGKRPREEVAESPPRPRGASPSTQSLSSFGMDETLSNSTALMIWKDDDTRRAAAKTTVGRRSPASAGAHSFEFFLQCPPMVAPMRNGLALPFDLYTPKPLESIGKPLDPFRTMWQASHPKVSVEELKWYCSRTFGTKAMGLHWVATMIRAPMTFLSTVCLASAHYDALHERDFDSVQTIALRQEVMHLVSQSLVNPQSRIDDNNIIALTNLIASEMISGSESALNYHESGVGAMIKQRGGLEELGVNGRVAQLISWVSLESAILRESPLPPMYIEYRPPTFTKKYPPRNALVPESPLYCPRGDFDTVKKSTRCTSRTLDLLKDIRMLLDLFLHETERNALSLKNIYKKIATQYPPARELKKSGALTPNEWRYEAVRIASIVTAVAITQKLPLSEALVHAAHVERENVTASSDIVRNSPSSQHSPTPPLLSSPLSTTPTATTNTPIPIHPKPPVNTPTTPTATATASTTPKPPTSSTTTALLTHLKHALQSSDLSDCWADMAGVLFWLALTIAAASRTSDPMLRKWFRALAVRVSVVLCFEHPEAVHRGLLRLGEVVAVVAVSRESPKVSGASGGTVKRRRVRR